VPPPQQSYGSQVFPRMTNGESNSIKLHGNCALIPGSRSRRAALIPKEQSEADSCGENAACSEASSLQENRLPRIHIYAIKPTVTFRDKMYQAHSRIVEHIKRAVSLWPIPYPVNLGLGTGFILRMACCKAFHPHSRRGSGLTSLASF